VKHDPGLLLNAMAAAVRAVSLIVMPICGMMMALARPLVLSIYGQRWATVADILPVLALYSAVFMLCLLVANMLTSFGRTKVLLVLQLLWICTLVPGMVIGVHKAGIVGAAYAHVAVILPIVLPSYLLVLKRVTGVRLTILGRAAMLAVLASSLAAIAAHAAASQFKSPPVQLIAGLSAGGVVYVICAGRQAAAVFGRGHSAERVLDFYSTVARTFGLPAEGRAKHAAGFGASGRGRITDGVNDAGPPQERSLSGQVATLHPRRVEDIAFGANMSDAYWPMDWPAQAVALYERTLAEKERQLGSDHAHTLASRTNLAHAYRRAGLLAEAIPLYERTVSDLQRLLGSDHPRTLRCSNYLAAAYSEVGRTAEAITLYEQTFHGRRRLFGADYPSTLRSSAYLARAYLDAGRHADAIPLFEQIVGSERRLLGADHPSTLRSSVRLAGAYLAAGRVADAISLSSATLARCRMLLGHDHSVTRMAHGQLSDMQAASQDQLPCPDVDGDHRLVSEEGKPRLISGSPPPSPDHPTGNGTSAVSASADVAADVQE
jgi:tetratricopeptide (TPR) repeat protein